MDLTYKQMLQALSNIGIDIEACGACAEVFYTGITLSKCEPDCPNPMKFNVGAAEIILGKASV